jgi:exosortase A-associated hydrolase 2
VKLLQEAFYLPVDGGECFCVYRQPLLSPTHGTILHLPPFGDEMNKSRAMVARTARAFAADGWGVLQVDLFGCGDSSGEHGEADFNRWIGNACSAMDWLSAKRPSAAPPWLWCLRAGALLAPALLNRAPDVSLLLWQPVLSGAHQLSQLLRQKLAGSFFESGVDRAGSKALRERLRSGSSLEVGGYTISSMLASGLERANFAVPDDYAGRIAWFEVDAMAPPLPSPAAQTKIAALRSSGIDVYAAGVRGAGFWQSTEIEICDALIEASVDAIAREHALGVSRDPAIF